MISQAPQSPIDTIEYRPISPWAVASIILAGGYALVMSLLTVVAYLKGTPVFLGWTLIFPVAAVALAGVGKLDVLRSEGTRTGDRLVKWGFYLGFFFGLGYLVFITVSYFVVQWQAEKFANQWFEKLRQPDMLISAFLDTMGPDVREREISAQEMMIRFGQDGPQAKAPLVQFQDNPIVNILRAGGPQSQIESLGVRQWEHLSGGYKVTLLYRIKTKEGEFDIKLIVGSMETKTGRQWRLFFWGDDNLTKEGEKLTDIGIAANVWKHYAQAFARGDWVYNRQMGKLEDTYLATLDAESRSVMAQQFARMAPSLAASEAGTRMAAGLGVCPFASLAADGNAHALRGLHLPGFQEYLHGKFLRTDSLAAPDNVKDDIIKSLRAAFPNRIERNMAIRWTESLPRLAVVDTNRNCLVFHMDVVLILAGGPTPMPKYLCNGVLIIESDTKGIDPKRPPTFKIVGLDVLRGDVPPKPQGPPGGGPPGMGGPGMGGH